MKKSWSFCIILIGVLCYTNLANAQSTPSNANNIDALQRRRILRSPNGLETLAKLSGGTFVLRETDQGGFFDYTLASAKKGSTLVLDGTITAASSHLVNDGNGIDTDYTVHPRQVIKGTASSDITLQIHGGKFTFPNGNSAEIDSLLTDHLKVGHSYLLFLAAKPNWNVYELVGTYQMVFDTSSEDEIIPLAKFDSQRHYSILDELETYHITRPTDLLERVKSAERGQ